MKADTHYNSLFLVALTFKNNIMERSKEMFLRMREDDFNQLSEKERSKFTYIEVREANEYENNKNDTNYLKLYKEQKKAKDNLQKYLFDKRNK